jgi:hypothetical protein
VLRWGSLQVVSRITQAALLQRWSGWGAAARLIENPDKGG